MNLSSGENLKDESLCSCDDSATDFGDPKMLLHFRSNPLYDLTTMSSPVDDNAKEYILKFSLRPGPRGLIVFESRIETDFAP